MIIILWYAFKLALILIPMHFWGEFRAEASFIDLVRNQPPAQVRYLIPNSDKTKPQVAILLSYPRHVVAGEQNFVTYEIENYDEKEPLEFDIRLKSGNDFISHQIVFFNSSSLSKVRRDLIVAPDTKYSVLEFQPQVDYQGSEYHYSKARQIQVHTQKAVLNETVWKWVDLLLFIVTLILWLLFLIWI